MTGDFSFDKRVDNERIEVDSAGNRLKKYGGTNTSHPTHTKVQMHGESHKRMMRRVNTRDQRVKDFMRDQM